ncbi:MAG: hypothetical protein H7288_09090 [Kineosporiaceae bacterium]|nr:hypothetical protein [Aeromicrobium sp.]
MGIFRDLVPLAIALGAIAFAGFAVPLAFAAAAIVRGSRLEGKWSSDALVWILVAGALLSGYICYDVAESVRTKCDYLQYAMSQEGPAASLSRTSFTQQYIDECH